MKHVFGPVPSRRLGRSLGVDVVPRKVCTFDCVYCQVGRTSSRTLQRSVFTPADEIVSEVRVALERGARPDYVTLSGSGEPTLHADLAAIIKGIKLVTEIPVALLTNASLFWDPEVREACALADLILPSLDAGDEEVFQAINRPAPGLTLERMVQGLAAFRKEYRGSIWLEVFIVEGLNSSEEQSLKIRAIAERIKPDRIQLNTAVRPTAEEVHAVPEERLLELCRLLGPHAEVIADFHGVHERPAFAAREEEVLAMISRRPCTLDDIAAGLGIHRNEAAKYVGKLLGDKLVRKERRSDRDYICEA